MSDFEIPADERLGYAHGTGDFRVASGLFAGSSRRLTVHKKRTLGLITEHRGRMIPTIGAVLLFGKARRERTFVSRYVPRRWQDRAYQRGR